ncbi:LOW QUALITY PROTEIN: craniofacial development protein 1 [Heliangelus exortis]|uniref:LOW QUALITY PROTEIN: craniofacial development protein 1 n=1 Tax=Heliangelus exortis TaxID=472823 RepID=UPI003A8D86EE
MSGSEEYSSAEDEDYVPSGAEYSEDDVSELVREEEVADSPRPPRGRRSPRRPASRKRKKRGLLLEEEKKQEESLQQKEEDEEEEDNVEQVERNKEEEKEKKKEDALWASFLSDVGQKPKAAAATQVTQAKKAGEEKSGNKLQEKPKESEKPKDSGKVTITKVFDFAGEEVRVTKEVDSTSKEAKAFLKHQEKQQAAAPASLPTVSGVKRPSGMSSLLGKIGSKKQKMSTLEKSKLDWESFKEEEGIVEELAIHNRGKDGYIERKAFLERVDHRQFEIERDLRLSRMKP